MIQLSNISVLVGTIALVFVFGGKVVDHIKYKRAQKRKGCLSPKRFKHYEPFLGLDLLYSMAMALKEHRFLTWQKDFFAAQGAKTFEATLLGSRMLYSSEPENMKAMSTSVEQDFGVEPIRNGNGAITPFTSHGTSTSDGEMWQYSRNLIKPYFDRDGYRNLHRLEVHVDKLLELVPTDDSTFDLQPLLQRWVIHLPSWPGVVHLLIMNIVPRHLYRVSLRGIPGFTHPPRERRGCLGHGGCDARSPSALANE